MKYQRKNKKFWGKRLGLAFFVCLLFLLGWLAPRLPLFCLSEGPVRIYYPYGHQTLARQALTESRVYLREMAAWLGLDAADTAREAPAAELTAGEKDSRPNLVRGRESRCQNCFRRTAAAVQHRQPSAYRRLLLAGFGGNL